MQKRLLLREAGLGPGENSLSSAGKVRPMEETYPAAATLPVALLTHHLVWIILGLVFFFLMKVPAAPSASSFWLIHSKENFVLGGNTLPSGRDMLPPGDLLPSALRLCQQYSRLREANKNKQKIPSTRSQQLQNNTGTTLPSLA